MSAADVRALHRQRLVRENAAQVMVPFPLVLQPGDRAEFTARDTPRLTARATSCAP